MPETHQVSNDASFRFIDWQFWQQRGLSSANLNLLYPTASAGLVFQLLPFGLSDRCMWPVFFGRDVAHQGSTSSKMFGQLSAENKHHLIQKISVVWNSVSPVVCVRFWSLLPNNSNPGNPRNDMYHIQKLEAHATASGPLLVGILVVQSGLRSLGPHLAVGWTWIHSL